MKCVYGEISLFIIMTDSTASFQMYWLILFSPKKIEHAILSANDIVVDFI